jgi:predicted membrane-bound dolichyl-phosphate-mannose-protein mannosyltransferase
LLTDKYVLNKTFLPYVFLIILLFFTIYFLTSETYSLYHVFGYKSYRDAYVSDEVWYVSSSRNILVKVFKVTNLGTNVSNMYFYTVVFKDKPNITTVMNTLMNSSCFIVEDNYMGSIPARVTVFSGNKVIINTIIQYMLVEDLMLFT